MIAEIPATLSWAQASTACAFFAILGVVIGILLVDWINRKKP
jgi:hypothetical protein